MKTKEKVDVFNKYGKNKSKLSMTGGVETPWFWRDGEIQYAEYVRMSVEEKKIHLKYLLKLSPKNRGTNDEYILRIYGPKEKQVEHNFFSIDETISTAIAEDMSPTPVNNCIDDNSTTIEINDQRVTNIPDDLTVEQIMDMGVEYVKEILDNFFKFEYDDWEPSVRFNSIDKFLISCRNFMLIDNLTEKHIIAYKNLKSK